MRDDMQGGLLATLIAVPAVIICCGGGGFILAAITGGVGGWLSGVNGMIVLMIAAGAGLAARSIRRGREACALPDKGNHMERKINNES